jgi:cytochrome P450
MYSALGGWLTEDKGRLAQSERTMLVFGAGKRTCIGMHVSVVTASSSFHRGCESVSSWRVWVTDFDVRDTETYPDDFEGV